MDGITNTKTTKKWNAYSVLSELVTSTSKHNNNLAHFEWDTELNLISYNEPARAILFLKHKQEDRTSNTVSECIPTKYLNEFNNHINDLYTSQYHLSTFSYEAEVGTTPTTITWVSVLDPTRHEKRVLTICCYFITILPLEESLTTLLKAIPTAALILGQDGQYIGCNPLMLRLLNIPHDVATENLTGCTLGTLGENPNLCQYIKTALVLAKPNLIKEIQTTFVDSAGQKVYYLFSYCRHNNSTIMVGLDISKVKRLEMELLASEERNAAILKALPEVLKASGLRRKDDKVNTLINQLTNDPIFTSIPGLERTDTVGEVSLEKDTQPEKDLYTKLIRLEVETREVNVRLKQIESLMFLGETSIMNKLKQAEVHHDTGTTKVQELEGEINKIKADIGFIGMGKKIINATPGGINTLIVALLSSMVGVIFLVSYLVETLGTSATLQRIRDLPSMNSN